MVPIKISSLVLLRKNGKVLLGWKKRGFGEGKWNGFGGKIEVGETMLQCARRELLEESGIYAQTLEKIGFLYFEFVEDPLILQVHVYSSNTFYGEPTESDEMRPQWFSESEIPLNKMWADDKHWFPLFLKGAKFRGHFKFLDTDTISHFSLEEVTEMCL